MDVITVVAAVLALLAGLLHVGIFVAETFLWRRPAVWQAFGIKDQTAADEAVFFTFNQGFYNLFLAAGAAVGAVCLLAGADTVGWTLLVFGCASMVCAAAALRLGGGAFYTKAATVQAALPALALVAAAIASVG